MNGKRTDNENKEGNNTTLPLENDAASKNSKKCAEFLEFETGKGFGEGIGNHIVSRTIG